MLAKSDETWEAVREPLLIVLEIMFKAMTVLAPISCGVIPLSSSVTAKVSSLLRGIAIVKMRAAQAAIAVNLTNTLRYRPFAGG